MRIVFLNSLVTISNRIQKNSVLEIFSEQHYYRIRTFLLLLSPVLMTSFLQWQGCRQPGILRFFVLHCLFVPSEFLLSGFFVTLFQMGKLRWHIQKYFGGASCSWRCYETPVSCRAALPFPNYALWLFVLYYSWVAMMNQVSIRELLHFSTLWARTWDILFCLLLN